MDTARHGPTQHDEVRHTLTVREVEALFAKEGVQRSHRHVLRLCQSGMLDAVKIPGGPSGDEWYVAPASVPKAIGDLKQIEAQRARRSATQRAVSHDDAHELPHDLDRVAPSHSAPQPDMSGRQSKDDGERQSPTQRATARQTSTYSSTRTSSGSKAKSRNWKGTWRRRCAARKKSS